MECLNVSNTIIFMEIQNIGVKCIEGGPPCVVNNTIVSFQLYPQIYIFNKRKIGGHMTTILLKRERHDTSIVWYSLNENS